MNHDTPFGRLREARKSAGYDSAAEAARRIGVSPITYTAHENGTREYDRQTCLAYARKFRVSPAWLMFGTGADLPPPQPDENVIPVLDFLPSYEGPEHKMLGEIEEFDEKVVRDFTVDTMRLPSKMAGDLFGSAPKNLFAMKWMGRIKGDARRAPFKTGDYLIADHSANGPFLGEPYLVASSLLPEVCHLKWHSRSESGDMIVSIDNATDDGDVQLKPVKELVVIGRVVGVVGQLLTQ